MTPQYPNAAERQAMRVRGIAALARDGKRIRDRDVQALELARVQVETARIAVFAAVSGDLVDARNDLRLASLRLQAAERRAARSIDRRVEAEDALEAVKRHAALTENGAE